jgi:hypothetical protein
MKSGIGIKYEQLLGLIILSAVVIMLFSAGDAYAFKMDNVKQGELGYELYDVFMNKILDGAIGWVAVAVLIVMALFSMVKGNIQGTVISLIVGLMIKAVPTIMSSLGATLTMVYTSNAAIFTAGILIW